MYVGIASFFNFIHHGKLVITLIRFSVIASSRKILIVNSCLAPRDTISQSLWFCSGALSTTHLHSRASPDRRFLSKKIPRAWFTCFTWERHVKSRDKKTGPRGAVARYLFARTITATLEKCDREICRIRSPWSLFITIRWLTDDTTFLWHGRGGDSGSGKEEGKDSSFVSPTNVGRGSRHAETFTPACTKAGRHG